MRTTVRTEIYHIERIFTRRKHMQIARATVSDESGTMTIVWFNQPYIAKQLYPGDQVLLAGTVELDGGLVMKNPDYERVSRDPTHAARIVPIYPETKRLTSRWLRPKIVPLLCIGAWCEEIVPAEQV